MALAARSAASPPLDSEPPKKKPKKEKGEESQVPGGEKGEESHVPGGEKEDEFDGEADMEPDDETDMEPDDETDMEPDDDKICDDYVSESDEEGLTSEEMAEYNRRLDASGGFDVPDFPHAPPSYRIGPYNCNPKLMAEHSLLAIKDFNAKNNLNYEFVKVIRSNCRVVSGFEFYITFEAKQAGEDRTQILEAKTWTLLDSHEVYFCRMKGCRVD